MNELNAETGVIGSILVDDACFAEVSEILSPEDFRLEVNRKIYEAALALNREGKPIDPVTVVGIVGEAYSEYILQTLEVTPVAHNAVLYAQDVRKASMRRSIRDLGMALAGSDEISDPRQDIGDAIRTLEGIEARDTAREIVSSTAALSAFYDHRQKIEQGTGGCVATGYPPLDRLLGGGLLPGGLYILAARPGVGKTAFALNVCANVLKVSPVLFVSLEMSTEEITARRIALETGLCATDLLMRRTLGSEAHRTMKQAAVKLSSQPFYLNRLPAATIDDIRHLARKVKGVKLIVIDYFGLISTLKKSGTRYEAMTEISGELKRLARAMNVPVLSLAQLNRANTQRSDSRPILSDLRDTGALEQDADAVIFLHRECSEGKEPEGKEQDPNVELEVILAKNRHGGVGKRTMSFRMESGAIRSQQSRVQANQTSFYDMPDNTEIPFEEDRHDKRTRGHPGG